MANLPVHPAAMIYPMWSDEELKELAESIKERGLHHPIEVTRWKETDDDDVQHIVRGTIDGRNREKACKLAGVEPEYKELDFNMDDELIRLYILDNNRRRNLSAGQLAMAWAMTFPATGHRPKKPTENKQRTKKPTEAVGYPGFSERRLEDARRILRYAEATAPGLETQVMNGTKKFDEAFKIVLDAARAAAKKEKAERDNEKYVTHYAPEKMALVKDGELTLEDAVEQVRDAEEYAKQEREKMFGRLKEFLSLHHIILDGKNIDEVPGWLENPDYVEEFHAFFGRGVVEFAEQVERIDDTANLLKALADKLKPAKDARPALRVVVAKGEDTK